MSAEVSIVWVVFFLEANLLLSLWSFKTDQDFYSKVVGFLWSRIR